MENNLKDIDFSGYYAGFLLTAIVHQTDSIPCEQYHKINSNLAFQVTIRAKEMRIKESYYDG